MTKPLRLGKIGYLNVLPIYHPLESGELKRAGLSPELPTLKIMSGPPAQLNEAMRRGELELSATSSIEYARNPDRYLLVPDLAIGSRGHVQSVLLLSRYPVAALEGRNVLVSSQTHTSAALMQLFLHTRLGVHPNYTTGSISLWLAAGNLPDAFLAIGDEALRLRDHPEYPHRWDLGSAWLDWTGLPFIFGVWIVSRQSLVRRSKTLRSACRALVASKEMSAARPDEIAALAARSGFLDQAAMRSYFDGLVFDFGPTEREGLRVFYGKLAEHGFINEPPKLEFFE